MDSLRHVVVLAAPAKERVGEPVDRLHVSCCHGDGATEYISVRQCVVELVYGSREVTR